MAKSSVLDKCKELAARLELPTAGATPNEIDLFMRGLSGQTFGDLRLIADRLERQSYFVATMADWMHPQEATAELQAQAAQA
jgi:hypothetical protein